MTMTTTYRVEWFIGGAWDDYAPKAEGFPTRQVAENFIRNQLAVTRKTEALKDSARWRVGTVEVLAPARYLGVHQDLHDAPCDYIKLDLSAAE